MKENKVTKMVEELVRIEYIAEDGKIFYEAKECEKYEASALFVISCQLKRLNKKDISVYDILSEGSDEDKVEIFDVQTEKDLENLRRYLYLTAKQNGATEEYIKECFSSEEDNRKDLIFDNVTAGHEVMIYWNYDCDGFWTYRDGSIEGYLEYLRDRITECITPKEERSFNELAEQLKERNQEEITRDEHSVGIR